MITHLNNQRLLVLGAMPNTEGTAFIIWAPKAKRVDVCIQKNNDKVLIVPLSQNSQGYWCVFVPEVTSGDCYEYRVNNKGVLPDPASRYQPQGVHGPSEVIDPTAYPWSDDQWKGISPESLIIYELHVGTFTLQGTFEEARKKLEYLSGLGVTAVELMPIADFSGDRNWGYDGISLYSPARCYGRPEDLQRFVDYAHSLNLAVILDVVYNHLGPDGNYLGDYAPYLSTKHTTPWGACFDLYLSPVREFLIENALQWILEYHIDGLRLDATQHLYDEKKIHFVRELGERLRASAPSRQIILLGEGEESYPQMCTSSQEGGWGFDGIWIEDFHHEIRRLITGENRGYLQRVSGTIEGLARVIRHGRSSGTSRFYHRHQSHVHYWQTHDLVGNLPHGTRLNHTLSLETCRALAVLHFLDPAIPLIFMGQEWAANTPFHFFTDHQEELTETIQNGRKQQFKEQLGLSNKELVSLPNPQANSTFLCSKLDWSELATDPHKGMVALYQDLIMLRHSEESLHVVSPEGLYVKPAGEFTLVVVRMNSHGTGLLGLVQLKGSAKVRLDSLLPKKLSCNNMILTTESDRYTQVPCTTQYHRGDSRQDVHLSRPGGIVFRVTRTETNDQ